ncbi:MAG: DUF2066 domain-containing protein [Gammaproteobacteria bacterium]
MTILKTLLFFLSMSILAPLTASAVVVEDLFEVKIPVLDESKEIRQTAQDDGLIEVLIRVSGDSNILEKIEAPVANSYVKRYEYMAVQATAETDKEPSKQLWVHYNATRIMDFLRQQAIPLWGDRRTQVVMWLAVNDGKQRYILKNNDASLIKSKANTAFSRRGVPTIWPENDAVDRQIIRFTDIRAAFIEPLKNASKRYSSGPVIAANMSWNGQMWKGEWSLLMDEKVKKWNLSGGNYENLIVSAADLIADVMGQKFAVLETSDVSQQKTVAVEVDRVKSVDDFRRIEKYLLSLSAVQSVQLSRLEPNRVFFDLTVRSKVDDLLNLIKSGSVMKLLSINALDVDKSKHELVKMKTSEVPTANITASDAPAPSVLEPRLYHFTLR